MKNILMMCKEHKLWIDTAGKQGKQLCLDETDMRTVKITPFMLEQSYYSECNFSGMTFYNIDFYQSELYSCDFTNAKFSKCDFRKCTLDYSNFSGATFVDCKFPRADAFQTCFDKCSFNNCSFVGFNIIEGSLNYAKFDLCDFDAIYLNKVSAEDFKLKKASNLDTVNYISLYITQEKIIEGVDAIKWLKEQNTET
jgi:uncharacterized protein YjbI with pentapeptide repeats